MLPLPQQFLYHIDPAFFLVHGFVSSCFLYLLLNFVKISLMVFLSLYHMSVEHICKVSTFLCHSYLEVTPARLQGKSRVNFILGDNILAGFYTAKQFVP